MHECNRDDFPLLYFFIYHTHGSTNNNTISKKPIAMFVEEQRVFFLFHQIGVLGSAVA